jgi:myxalamid-type polyketide synthase MxaE and MxaD
VRGADGPDELWDLLRQGKDLVGPNPPRCWPDLYDPNPFARGKTIGRHGCFLDDVEGMDWRFFGVSPREARAMDPQHRLLLEVAWEALEDAGLPAARAAGTRAGVFVGIMLNDYGKLYGRNLRQIDGYTVANNTFAYAANRLSFFYDLRGPSLAIDTNCSGSLVAIHQACRSIWSGESEWALAGGVSLILAPDADISLGKATISPTGHIRTWDVKADGMVRGEGAGLVVVKPLASALAARDRIYAVVLGTATNHTGRGSWIMDPSAEAQATAITEACSVAGIRPEDLQYVEVHGSGTPKGDPVEAEGLGRVMATRPASDPCRVGSIKTNIGHLDAAAGVVGLMKTALCIHRRTLVPSLHFEEVNPQIDLERLRVRVQTTTESWPRGDLPPTAGVTSVGFGGTNVHVVLQGVETSDPSRCPERGSYVLPLSAKTDQALFSMAERFATWLEAPGSNGLELEDIAYTLGARRTHHGRRLAVAGASRAELVARLRDGKPARPTDDTSFATNGKGPRLVFVFPGHGPQWVGMARDLLQVAPVFAETIERCETLIQREGGWSLASELHAAPERSRLDEPAIVQPVLFAVGTALTELYRSWGIVPDAVIGHSFGEITAAVAAGVLTLEEGVRITCARGQLTQRRAGHGGVAMVELPAEDLRALLGRYETLEVGGENSPRNTLVTGAIAELDALVSELTARDVFARRVNMAYASHGRDMECLLDDFRTALGPVAGRPANALFCSTVEGRFVDGKDLNTGYWLRNLREPVRFVDAVRRVVSDVESIFIEISPHPVLASAMRQSLDGVGAVVLASLRRGQPSLPALDESLCKLYEAGLDPNFGARHPDGRVVSTPTYPWQRERMWLEMSEPVRAASEPVRPHPLLGRRIESSDPRTLVWEQILGGAEVAYFRDHCLQDVPSASTSAMVEMMLVSASSILGTERLEIVDLELLQAFVLPEGVDYRVQTVLTAGTGEWAAEIRGRDDDRDRGFRTHCRARIRAATAAPEIPRYEAPFEKRISKDVAYDELARLGIQYGPAFQGIDWLSREGEAVLASVRMPEGLDASPYYFHPAFHDAAMHVAVLAETCSSHTGFVPVRMRRLWVASRPTEELRSHARVTEVGGVIHADVRIENADGSLVELIEGVELVHLDDAIASDISSEESSWLYEIEYKEYAPAKRSLSEVPAAENGNVFPAGSWLILSDRQGVGAALADQINAGGGFASTITLDETRDPELRDEALLRDIRAALGPDGLLTGVVHLANLDLPVMDGLESTKLDAAIVHGTASVFSLLRALEEVFPASPTPVWLVTRGAQPWALDAADIAPLQAPVWGLGRTIAGELPARWGGLVDLDPATPPEESAAKLWTSIRAERETEDELVFRRDSVYVPRLTRRHSRAPRHKLEVRADASYLITGGTGGLGLKVASWLAARGAKHLVLVARTALPPRGEWTALAPESPFVEAIEAIQAIETLGASVRTVALDVANERAVIEFLNEHEHHGFPPIRGVLHLAGTVHMEDLLQVNEGTLLETLRPKIHGALSLHAWLEDLDFFVLFSSAASVIRSPRLAHYAAGNAFLDALAHYRRARGQSAAAFNWGVWREVGFIRRLGDRGQNTMAGTRSIAPDQGIRILEHLVESGDVQAVVWPPDWQEWAERYPAFMRTSFVADLLAAPTPAKSEAPGQHLGAAFNAMPRSERAPAVTAYMAREIAERLRIELKDLPVDAPLERFGFDSLQATELQARLLEDIGVRIPVMRFLGFSSIASIAEEVVDRLEAAAPRASVVAGPVLETDVRKLTRTGAASNDAGDSDGDPIERLGS